MEALILAGGKAERLGDAAEGRPKPLVLVGGRVYTLDSARPWVEAVAVRGTRNGYNVIGWADSDFAYFAASDLDRDDLDTLQDDYNETAPQALTREASHG